MRKYPFAPHPFIITPPLEEKKEYHRGEKLDFELTLIGKAIDFLPYFIYTFDELGRTGIGKGKGKYCLEGVWAKKSEKTKGNGERGKGQGERPTEEETTMIYSGKEKTLHNDYKIMSLDDLGPSGPSSFTSRPLPLTLDLRFVTPTRLKFDGKLSPGLEFHILLRNLLRRISLLSYFHCDEELDLDFKGLIETSRDVKVKRETLSWFDWERYSSRQDTTMRLGGFIGSITFEGNLEPFMPFLLLGEYVHIGKGTSFGLGKYKIEF